MGGFKAVVYTDVIQYLGMIALMVLMVFVLTKGISITSLDWNLFSAGPAVIIGFLIIGLLIPFASPDLWQRVYSAKDKKTVKKSIFYSVLIYFFVCLMLAIIALAVKTLLPQLDPDTALIYGFGQLLSPGLAGLAIVLLFAAIMSSIDTYAFTTSSAVIQGFFRKLNKGVTIKAIKLVITMLLILSTILVIVLENMVLSTYIFTGFVIVLAIPTLATWFRKKVNPLTLAISFIISFIGIIYILLTAPVLDPSLVSKMILISLSGLLIGGIVSMIVKKYKK
jgi:SSS family solute:Na+ symporter